LLSVISCFLQYLRKISVLGHRIFLIYAVSLMLCYLFKLFNSGWNTFLCNKLSLFSLPNCQIPLGLAITWTYALLLTEAGFYNYKGCDVNIPASNMLSEHCKKHYSRMKHCRVDTSHALKSSPWFRFPYPLQWGTPVFHWKMALVMCVVSVISSVDSVSFLSFFLFLFLDCIYLNSIQIC
jgi:nucleobase transporter 1/2